MKKTLLFFDKRVDISQPYIRLFLIIFFAAVLAKGAVLFCGYAVDDYVYIFGLSEGFGNSFSQGRYFTAATVWLVDSFGANINDMYFALGIVTLFLQAAFVVSLLRFVGMESSPSAGLVGAIMIAHPYLTEILTFRMALSFYSASLLFSIIALEMAMRNPATWHTRSFSLLATFAMLLTYQSFLNYFAVAIIFAFIIGQVLHNKNDQSLATDNAYRERAITLTIISTISTIAFVLIIWLTKVLGLTTLTGRANFVAFNKIPERIGQISSSLVRIYWSAEPIFSGWLKTLVALMLALSVLIVFNYLLSSKRKENYIRNVFFVFFAFLLLLPVSLGVIIPFGDWHPVPRVVAHVAIIIGLISLTADACMQDSSSRFLKSIIFVSRIIVLVGFIFISNQILADQQRINQWDKMMANRIISRLEMHPDFSKVKYVHVNGGLWGFPVKLRTMQGDMNVSAFHPDYSKVPLLSEVSGYRFEKATGDKAAAGKTYCETKQPWPHAESIAVDNDLAIICLPSESSQKKNIAFSVDSLSISSSKGDLKTVKSLLDEGVDVNARDSRGSRALIDASWAGQKEIVSYLLDKKADVNLLSSSKYTALSAAINQRHVPIALLLLEHGANSNVVDPVGSTPLIEAAWQGNLPLVKALLAKGATPNYKRPDNGFTALKAAGYKTDIVKALKAAGATE
jgi:hypothetical protein